MLQSIPRRATPTRVMQKAKRCMTDSLPPDVSGAFGDRKSVTKRHNVDGSESNENHWQELTDP